MNHHIHVFSSIFMLIEETSGSHVESPQRTTIQALITTLLPLQS